VSQIQISAVAVTFQAIGALLLAFMLRQIGKNFDCPFVRHWGWGWLAMFVAIGSVRVFIATGHRELWVLYLLAQWLFMLLLYSGCRVMTEPWFDIRRIAFLSPSAVVLATLSLTFARSFNQVFIVEAGIVAAAALASFVALGRDTRRTTGWQTMRLALVLMGTLYGLYVPLFAMETAGTTIKWLAYSPLADLLSAILLAFGMVIVASEEARRELTDAVQALQVARDQLELKLKIDPLTDALTRHAFHAMPHGVHGVVLMIDVDNLKQINDVAGHASGDAAIRAVANAVRNRIRADDLLFRWGGDEFLVIVPGSTLERVERRLGDLGAGVQSEDGTIVHFSWGAAEFGMQCPLDQAMHDADAQMYARRAAARTA
jgi:diguanylate cyclase (GGDEF)-like protein